MLGEPKRTSYSIVRNHWQQTHGGTDFDKFWRKALHDGIIPELAPRPALKLTPSAAASSVGSSVPSGLELVFRTDPSIFDGRFANNSWLQELPKPLSKITWDNAIQLSPATAGKLGIANEDVVEVRHNNRSIPARPF
jgi:molybdopterin-containing oxidoreductase family iron-sulfur binding subunit